MFQNWYLIIFLLIDATSIVSYILNIPTYTDGKGCFQSNWSYADEPNSGLLIQFLTSVHSFSYVRPSSDLWIARNDISRRIGNVLINLFRLAYIVIFELNHTYNNSRHHKCLKRYFDYFETVYFKTGYFKKGRLLQPALK